MAYYRCRYPREYGLVNTIAHPSNVHIRQGEALPRLDGWLAGLFEPDEIERTVAAMCAAQPTTCPTPPLPRRTGPWPNATRSAGRTEPRSRRADPAMIAAWTAEVHAQRAAALARVPRPTTHRPMTERDIHASSTRSATSARFWRALGRTTRAQVYQKLGVRLIYEPVRRIVRATVEIDTLAWMQWECPRGDSDTYSWNPCRRQGFM